MDGISFGTSPIIQLSRPSDTGWRTGKTAHHVQKAMKTVVIRYPTGIGRYAVCPSTPTESSTSRSSLWLCVKPSSRSIRTVSSER